MVTVGVLALQGGVKEHLQLLDTIGVAGVPVKTQSELSAIDGLIIPGGESTTIAKLLTEFQLQESVQSLINSGIPVLGTCAGLILLSKEIDSEPGYFDALSCSVERNAYGSQLASGEALVRYDDKIEENAAFIRAPRIVELVDSTPIAWVGDEIVAIKQANVIGASYHPELTNSTKLHRKLIELIKAD